MAADISHHVAVEALQNYVGYSCNPEQVFLEVQVCLQRWGLTVAEASQTHFEDDTEAQNHAARVLHALNQWIIWIRSSLVSVSGSSTNGGRWILLFVPTQAAADTSMLWF